MALALLKIRGRRRSRFDIPFPHGCSFCAFRRRLGKVPEIAFELAGLGHAAGAQALGICWLSVHFNLAAFATDVFPAVIASGMVV
ncbi:MAG TPA: hypothetical protein VGI80_09790, partial [Pyrinomonadaceae bacterium]